MQSLSFKSIMFLLLCISPILSSTNNPPYPPPPFYFRLSCIFQNDSVAESNEAIPSEGLNMLLTDISLVSLAGSQTPALAAV